MLDWDSISIVVGFVDDHPTFVSITRSNKRLYNICKEQTQNPIQSLMRFWQIEEYQLIYQNPWLEPEINKRLYDLNTNKKCFVDVARYPCIICEEEKEWNYILHRSNPRGVHELGDLILKMLQNSDEDVISLEFIRRVTQKKISEFMKKVIFLEALIKCKYEWKDVFMVGILDPISLTTKICILAKRFGR